MALHSFATIRTLTLMVFALSKTTCDVIDLFEDETTPREMSLLTNISTSEDFTPTTPPTYNNYTESNDVTTAVTPYYTDFGDLTNTSPGVITTESTMYTSFGDITVPQNCETVCYEGLCTYNTCLCDNYTFGNKCQFLNLTSTLRSFADTTLVLIWEENFRVTNFSSIIYLQQEKEEIAIASIIMETEDRVITIEGFDRKGWTYILCIAASPMFTNLTEATLSELFTPGGENEHCVIVPPSVVFPAVLSAGILGILFGLGGVVCLMMVVRDCSAIKDPSTQEAGSSETRKYLLIGPKKRVSVAIRQVAAPAEEQMAGSSKQKVPSSVDTMLQITVDKPDAGRENFAFEMETIEEIV